MSMPSPQLIGPVPRSTPTPSGAARTRAHELPRDLQREASTRLATMCLLAAAVWTVATLFGHVAATMMTGVSIMRQGIEITDAISILVVAVSIALFVVIRRGERDPAFVLDLGLWYMVFQAFALGMMFHWYPIPPGFGLKPELSWIGMLVLMFAALVPNTPRKMAIASFVAVLMNPLGMFIADARGTWDFGGAKGIVVMHYPDFIVAGVAVFISHVVMRLGIQIRKAREMGSYQLGELLGRGGMGEV
ncbi:MAG TPA: hypothetical protein VHM67_16395, partial [Gemmatimonadaceae bacterium]|nr:hypothetical protein [Gemmatimonadaceae bacterium]